MSYEDAIKAIENYIEEVYIDDEDVTEALELALELLREKADNDDDLR